MYCCSLLFPSFRLGNNEMLAEIYIKSKSFLWEQLHCMETKIIIYAQHYVYCCDK